jgi:hypothetical protein
VCDKWWQSWEFVQSVGFIVIIKGKVGISTDICPALMWLSHLQETWILTVPSWSHRLGMNLAEFFLQRAHDWLLPDMEVMIGLWIAIKLWTCGIKEALGWGWELWECRGIRHGVGQWKDGHTVDVIVLPYKNPIECPTSLFLPLSSLNHHAYLQFHHHC